METITKQNICRACLTERGSFQSVFVKETSSDVSMNISEMLSACATIQVNEGDGLPDQICSECSEQTVKMYIFKLRCEQSDFILRKKLEKRKAESVAEFKCKIDEEIWEKNDEKICYESLIENSETKGFVSDICQENVNQDDLIISHKIIRNLKVEKLGIIDENIEIKYNSTSSIFTESKECLFPCPECDSIFYEKETLDEHISKLHIKKEFKVTCNENLKRKQQLAKINSLLINNPHGCDICFKGFSQKSKLKEHMKTHTSTSTQPGEKSTISDVVCNKEFLKSFKCDICEKTFTDSSHFRRHRRIHTCEKPYECDVCKKRFKRLHHLISHEKIHTGEKPYECDVCRQKFSHLHILVRHKRIHSGEKPFKCDLCKKRFRNSTDLGSHNKLHTGEKPLECKLCKKRFRDSSGLSKHKRIHTGEKRFECEICKKKFRNSSGLKYHKRIHTDEKPFECDVCQMKFSQTKNLKRHKTSHKI